jgi:hypothetical protein
MAIELSIEVSGDPQEAKSLAEAIVSSPIEDEDRKVSVAWSPPALVPGMTETTYELLGVIGVLSFPLSVVASIVANLITTRLSEARAKVRKQRKSPQRGIPEPRITLTVVGMQHEKIVKLEMSQCDEAESVAICKALIDASDAE